MKKFKVKLHDADKNDLISDYSYTGFRTALCSKPEKYVVDALTSFEYCREVVAHRLRSSFTGTAQPMGTRGDLKEIDYNRFRLLTVFKMEGKGSKTLANKRNSIDKNLSMGIKLLNHFEERHGWGMTKIYETDNNGQFVHDRGPKKIDRNDNIRIFMVVSSKKWMKSPATVSLHLLLLRLGFHGFRKDFNSHEELVKLFKAYAKSDNYNDAYYIRTTFDKWDILLGNLNRIYAGRNAKNIYSAKALSSANSDFQNEGFNEGLSELCLGRSGDIITTDRFKELCSKHGLEQKSEIKDYFNKKNRLEKELKRLERARKKSYEDSKSK